MTVTEAHQDKLFLVFLISMKKKNATLNTGVLDFTWVYVVIVLGTVPQRRAAESLGVAGTLECQQQELPLNRGHLLAVSWRLPESIKRSYGMGLENGQKPQNVPWPGRGVDGDEPFTGHHQHLNNRQVNKNRV